MKKTKFFLQSEDAATAVEYAVMLALILVSIIGAISSVGAGTGGMWSNVEAQTSAAFAAGGGP